MELCYSLATIDFKKLNGVKLDYSQLIAEVNKNKDKILMYLPVYYHNRKKDALSTKVCKYILDNLIERNYGFVVSNLNHNDIDFIRTITNAVKKTIQDDLQLEDIFYTKSFNTPLRLINVEDIHLNTTLTPSGIYLIRFMEPVNDHIYK